MSCMIDGNPDAPILLIGMAPGKDELAQDRPFVGGSGRLLWSLGRAAGFSRADCYIVNAIGEWPNKKQGGPSRAQLDLYWDRFDEAIKISKARVAICLGGDAFDRFTGIPSAERKLDRKAGIEQWRGYVVEPSDCQPTSRTIQVYGFYKTNTKNHKKGDPKISKQKVAVPPVLPQSLEYIFPTLHPAAVLRTGLVTLPALGCDLKRAGRALRGELNLVTLKTVPPSDLGTTFVIDVETAGKEPPMNKTLIRVGAATPEGAWSLPWDYASATLLRGMLKRAEVVVAHNAPFDLNVLEANDVI